MKIGQIYRASNQPEKQNPALLEVDGYPNFYYHTHMPNMSKIQFQKGVHAIAKVKLVGGGYRIPAIIVSSSPHRYGTEVTPWEDIYDPDFGRVRYYGDNKSNATRPEEKEGNQALLKAFQMQSSPDINVRINEATPVIFIERTSCNGATKGYLKFHGYGVVESVELITQYDVNTSDGYFSNYVFNMCVFSLVKDNEDFSWDWINARRDANLTNEETLKYAPMAWQEWVRNGVLTKVRRHVYSSQIVKAKEQKLRDGSKDEKILNEIYNYFEGKKHLFELFAMKVTEEVFKQSGADFKSGWVTQKSSDGGIDFVARNDIGTGLARLKTIVIGQAKCESPDAQTNGVGIARTVARLKRGWVGVYVTTSYFSEAVQKEVLDDQCPIMLINGMQIVKAVQAITYREGISLEELLRQTENEYPSKCANRRPEEILFD